MKISKLKKILLKVVIAVLPILALAINVSANSVASPINGQPSAPASLKNHRKF